MANVGDPLPDLQFEKVQTVGGASAAGVACASCQQPIGDFYFEWTQQPYCAPCKDKTIAAAIGGWGGWRLFKAVMFGSIAGLIGACIYCGVTLLTGYEIGLISIVVGWLVGTGVRLGCAGRGGWLYQLLAVLLTYLAIAAAYGGFVIKDMLSGEFDLSAAASQPVDSSPAGSQPVELSSVAFLVATAFVLVALPIFSSMESPVGFIIIGVALWQAWSICRRTNFNFAGPFAVTSPSPPLPPVPGSPAPPEQSEA